MQSFIAACVIAVVIAIGAVYVLSPYQESSEMAYTYSNSVRL